MCGLDSEREQRKWELWILFLKSLQFSGKEKTVTCKAKISAYITNHVKRTRIAYRGV